MGLSEAHAMTEDAAFKIAAEVEEAVRKWGKQAKVNYRPEQVAQALAILYKASESAVSKEELNTARRQLGACKARYAKATGKKLDDDEGKSE